MNIMEPLSTSISGLGILKKTEIKQNDIVPFEQFISTPAALDGIHNIQKVAYKKLGDKAHIDAFSLNAFKLYAEIHQVGGTAGINSKTELAQKIINNLTARSQIQLLDVGSLASMEEEQLLSLCSEVGIDSFTNPEFTAKKLKDVTTNIAKKNILKVAQLNYIATIAQGQEEGLDISNRILREVSAISGGTLSEFNEAVEQQMKLVEADKELSAVADSIQSNMILGLEERVELKALDFDEPIVIGIDNPKYVSRGRFQYAMTQGGTSEGLILPTEIRYYSILSDQCIGVNFPIDNSFLAKYNLAPYNKEALEYSLAPFDDYLQKHGLIGAVDERENNIVITKTKDRYTVYNVKSGETTIEEFRTLTALADSVLSQPIVFDSIDFTTLTMKLEEYQELNTALQSVSKISELTNDDLTKHLSKYIDASGLTRKEKESALRHAYVSDLSSTYRQSLIEQHPPAISIHTEELANALNSLGQLNESASNEQAPSALSLGDRILSNEVNTSGRILEMDEETTTIVPDWLFEARNSGSQIMRSIDLEFFNDISANSFAKIAPASMLTTDITQKFNPLEADGIENIKSASEEELSELAHLLSVNTTDSLVETRNGVIAALNARVAAFEVLNGSTSVEQAKEALEQFCTPCQTQDDIKAWLLKETAEASKRVQSLHFVKLLNECEKFGYAKQEMNVAKLSTQSLELASKVEALEGTTLVNKNHSVYAYWSQMLNQEDPLLIEVTIDQDGYSEIQMATTRAQESVEENQIEVGYDEGQGLIAYHEDSYQIVSATGQPQENGNVEFVTGLETHLVSSDLVIPFEQEKLDSMGAKLGLEDNQSFVTTLSMAQERSSNLTYPDTAYASLVIDALAAGIQLHSQNKELKVSEHDLGRYGEQYAYYNSQGAAVASGKTIEDAQAELITKLIEVKNEISAVSERNTDSVQSDDAGPVLSAGATGSSQSRSRGNVINNGEGIRDSSSENSAKAIGRNTESERLHSDERNASKSKGRNNSNRSTNSDGKTRTKIYDFTKQQALTDDSVSNSVKFQYNVSAIRVLKLLEQEERQPTPDEIETLGLYSGWGGLGKDIESYQYVQLNAELRELVSDDEYSEIKASALTAFYTPVPVVQGVWKSLEHMGFEGGRVYDPSMGLGNFFGLMPERLAANSKLAGGELDTITAGIAKFLQSDVIVKNTGFEKSLLPADYFDVMTSNIPFGNFKIHDPAYNKHNLNIHNYFIAKSLDTIKPGGVVAYITTTYTMDSQSTKARELFYKSSDLVSAIRLPNDVFKKHAGTNVNADLLIFRKRHDHEPAGDESWIDAFHYNKSMYPKLHYNNYFRNNPQNVMGELEVVPSQFGPSLANYTDEAFETAFDRIVPTLPTNVFDSLNQNESQVASGEMKAPPPTVALALDDQDEGSLVVVKDEIYMVEKRWDSEQEDHVPALIEFEYTQSKKARLVALIELKQAVREHLNVQIRNLPLASFEESKAKLNDKYDTFFKKYGPVNNRTNISLIKADTQAPLLMALDSVNTETGENQKADIFTERTVNVTPYPTEVNSLEDAIELSVARNGAVNMDFIGQLVDKSNESIYEESENLFVDPETGGYVHGSRYLSGNLADKLARAEHAVSLGENQFDKNIAALKAAFPKPLSYGDIKFQLGSSWMPKDYIRQFIFHIATGKDANSENDLQGITVSKCADLWDISLNWSFERKHQAKLENEWAGGGISADKLLVKIANGDKIEVAQTIDGKRTVLIEATQQARQAAEHLKNEYFEWMGNSPERRQHVASLYNSTINVIAQPKYNAEHLQFTQLNPLFNNKKFEPRKTQREAVVRYKVDGTALLAHGVGSGKSFELCAMAREGKIAGVHNKAMISVPNNVFGQFARMFQQHYPSAKVLSIDSASLNAVGRKAMTARIALNNWDAVIVPHSFLSKISAPPEFIINQIRDQASELRNAMDIAEGIGSYNLKRSEKRLKSLESKIEKRLNQESKDDLLYLSDLGIDALMIDESDNFLNLPTPSNMSHVSGVNTSESNRAMNLLFIARYLQEKNDGKGLVMATGTDIRKSMSDMYVNMYYLMPQELRKMGLLSFDSFMSTFGEVITAIEASPEGTGYRENSRLAKFNNLPELGQLYRMVADVVTTDESGAQREKAEKKAVQASGGEFFKAYMDNIARRAQNFRNGNPDDEAWFSIQSSAQRAAFDLRMIDSRIPEAKDCKINLCAKKIIEVLKNDTSDIPVTQLVFIDRYVNPTDDGFSPYDTLIDKLVAGGIPRDKIITSREVVTEPQKKAFQDNMNAGNYLVAIGTTEKFGVGNNIQKYLKAMHELTPPWNPREIEQRSGRIERSGNLQTDLKMFRYSTENSFDLFQWEHIRRKALYIAQTKTNPALAPRTYVEEVDANFEEMMSIATANPLIKEKIDLDKAIDMLSREKRMLQDKQTTAIYTIEEAKNSISRYERIIKDCETAVQTMKSNPDNIDLSGAFVDDKEKVEKAFKLARAAAEKKNEDTFVFGNYKGLEITVDIISNGPKKMPTLQGSTVINGHERPVIDTYYTTAFASRIIELQEAFTQTIHDSKEAIERANSRILNYEPLSKLTFDKEEELSACKERFTELQTELVEMANNMNEVDSADWSEIVAQLGGGRQEPDGSSLMDLMD
jgi:N12 class adenine-specific DNA methylase